jgi:hypothetical protein
VLDIEVPETMTYSDLSRLNAHAMNLLLMGKLQPRVAAALAQLSNSQIKVFHGAELEARVAALEKELSSQHTGTARQPNEDAVPPAPRINEAEPTDEVTRNDSEEGSVEPIATEIADAEAEPEYLDVAAPDTGDGEEDEAEPEQ